jgi:hypothetical protein
MPHMPSWHAGGQLYFFSCLLTVCLCRERERQRERERFRVTTVSVAEVM